MTSLAPTAYTALLTIYSQSDGEVQPSIVRYWWVFILIAILVFPVVLTAVLARIEKRLVWAYGSLEDKPQFDDVEGYGQRWVGDALKEGFHFLGWAPDLKGRIYQVCYAFLISPNRDHLIIVGMGSVLRIKVRGTWIYTIAANNKAICSTDNQACVHIDGARDWRTQLVSTNTFAGLLQSHKDLV